MFFAKAKLKLSDKNQLETALRIMGSQNWWFGDPRTLRHTDSNPSFWQGYRFKPLFLAGLPVILRVGEDASSIPCIPSWWFQPILKILVKLDHFPR